MVHVRFQIFSGVKYFSWNVSDGYKTQTFDHQLYPASHSVNLMNLFNWTLNLCKCSYFYFKSWNILLRRAQHPTSPVPAHLICITIHDVTGVQCGAEDLSLSLSLSDLVHYNTAKVSLSHSSTNCSIEIISVFPTLINHLSRFTDFRYGRLDPLDWPSQLEVVSMHTLDIWKNKKILLFSFI